MRDFVGRLLRSLPVGSLGHDRHEMDGLASEVVRLYEAGRYREATIVSRRLVALQRRRLGARHPDLATAKTSLALLLQKQGEFAEPEPLLRESLDIRREALGELHPQYAASLGHLADLFQQRGDLDAAEPLMRRALKLSADGLGDRHPNHAAALTALALLLHRRGDHADAEPLLREALAIRREALGDRHPMTATALSTVGQVLHRRGGHAVAEPLLREALAIRLEALGDRHPDTGASLAHLGALLFERGETAAAEPLLRSAVALRTEILGVNHPEVVANRETLDAILRSCGHVAPPPPSSDDNTPEPPPSVGRAARELADEARALADSFAPAAARLAEASARMKDGLPPEAAVLDEATALRLDFARLHDEALCRAATLGLEEPDAADSVAALVALLDRLAHEETERSARDAARCQALALLDRVLTLRHRGPTAPERVVRRVLDAASALRGVIAASGPACDPSPEVIRLLDGSHPLTVLPRLIESALLDDDAWLRAYRTTAAAFGATFAAAAARGRLVFESRPIPHQADAKSNGLDHAVPFARPVPEKSNL